MDPLTLLVDCKFPNVSVVFRIKFCFTEATFPITKVLNKMALLPFISVSFSFMVV
jgi:hypothetical protein